MGKYVKQWITVNGKHIPIFEGETKEDAVKRITNKQIQDDEDRKERQIAENRKQAQEKNKPLEDIEDEQELRKAMRKMFIEEGSYINDPEYQEVQKKVSDSITKRQEISDKISELRKVVDKGSAVDNDVLAEFGGNRALAKMFAEKTPEAEKAEKEIDELYKQKKSLDAELEESTRKMKSIDRKESERQKEKYNSSNSTVRKADKKEYVGFDLDTHTPKYQDLLERGKAEIVEMSPKEYLQLCAYKIFPDSTYEKQVRAAIADAKHTKDLVKLMKSGTKMYCPVLDFNDEQQEGRHRAVAAMILGLDKIPVTIVRKNIKK